LSSFHISSILYNDFVTAESGAAIGVVFGHLESDKAPHPTVEVSALPATDLTPDPLVPSRNNGHHLDLSPGSPEYEALVAKGVIPIPVTPRVIEAGYFPRSTPVSPDRMREIFGINEE